MVGYRTLLKYLTRRLSLSEAAEIGGRLLNNNPQSVKLIHSPYVELVMDGDKPQKDGAWEPVNKGSVLWARPKKEISDEE